MGIIRHKLDENSAEIVAWGRVTRDAELRYTKNKNLPKVTWSIAYHEGQYLNCVTIGDHPETQTAKCLEKGDTVLIAGVFSRREYNKRDGGIGVWTEVLCDVVTVQTAPAGAANISRGDADDMNIIQPPPAVNFLGDEEDDSDLPF